jgi:hypothetical protein
MPIASTIGLTLLALLIAPLLIGVCLQVPRLVTLMLIAILVMCSSSTWGQLQVENTIYARGTGLFTFSLLNLVLFMAGMAVLLRRLANPYLPRMAPAPLAWYFIGFTSLLAIHALVGGWLGVDLKDTLGYAGIINVLNMLIFMYMVMSSFRSEREQHRLLSFVIALAALRGVFGLVRYLLFAGDSANPYKNFERMDIDIFFFDIADNFVASLAAFWAAWLLMANQFRIKRLHRAALFALLLLEIAAVALSYRRASLIGLALMFVFLLFRLPPARRSVFLLFAGAVLLASAAVFFQQRLQYASHGEGNLISTMVYDLTKSGPEENRLYELWAAAHSLAGNWLTGLGTWGSFTGDQEILSYHFGRFDFVHSGFGHIILKTGLIGLLLFAGTLAVCARHYARRCTRLTGYPRLLSDCGFAGLLFWLPTLFIGTPIIEFRSMLMLGLTLALPFLATAGPSTAVSLHANP